MDWFVPTGIDSSQPAYILLTVNTVAGSGQPQAFARSCPLTIQSAPPAVSLHDITLLLCSQYGSAIEALGYGLCYTDCDACVAAGYSWAPAVDISLAFSFDWVGSEQSYKLLQNSLGALNQTGANVCLVDPAQQQQQQAQQLAASTPGTYAGSFPFDALYPPTAVLGGSGVSSGNVSILVTNAFTLQSTCGLGLKPIVSAATQAELSGNSSALLSSLSAFLSEGLQNGTLNQSSIAAAVDSVAQNISSELPNQVSSTVSTSTGVDSADVTVSTDSASDIAAALLLAAEDLVANSGAGGGRRLASQQSFSLFIALSSRIRISSHDDAAAQAASDLLALLQSIDGGYQASGLSTIAYTSASLSSVYTSPGRAFSASTFQYQAGSNRPSGGSNVTAGQEGDVYSSGVYASLAASYQNRAFGAPSYSSSGGSTGTGNNNTSPPPASPPADAASSALPLGAIIGGVIGGLAFVILVVLAILHVQKRVGKKINRTAISSQPSADEAAGMASAAAAFSHSPPQASVAPPPHTQVNVTAPPTKSEVAQDPPIVEVKHKPVDFVPIAV